jgi:type IV pilus assembly protein PilQ
MYSINHSSKRIWRNIGLLSALAFIIGVMEGCASKAPAGPGAVEPEAAFGEKVIHEITVAEEATQTLVVIKGNEPLPYTSVKHLLPLGVVLYFPKASLKGVQETYTPESTVIKSIVTTQLRGRGGYSRIQINLKEDVSYKANLEENHLFVYFRKPIAERTPTLPEPERVIEVEEIREARAEGVEPEVPAPVSAEAEKVGKPAWVNRIDFVMLKGRKSSVIVGTTDKVRFETAKPSEKRLLLKLFNTKIPKFQKRPLITTRFKSAVDRVVPIQTAKMGDTAVIAIQLRETVPYRVEQKENVLVVDLEPSTVPPRPLPDVKAPKWRQVMKEAEAEIVKEAEVPPEEPVLTKAGKVYTGQKISLDFQDADIRHVFRILHEISGKNFVIGDDVKGRVTLKLDNVPWDQVLDLVLSMNKLGSAEEGNVVRIARLSTLEAENKALKTKTEAEQAAKKLEPRVTEYISINYADASSIKTHLDEIKTDRGKVTIDDRTNMIIMKDIQAVIDDATEVVKRLDVVTPQVMIEARIVEANASFTQDIGVQWGGDTESASTTKTYRLFGGPTYTAGGQNWAVNLPPGTSTSGLGFTFGRIAGTTINLDARLLAMETQGKGRTISAPKIMTLDNKQATIKQGTSIPYQKSEEGTVSIEFAQANLELTVTPHITPDNRISMEISAKKDSPDWANAVGGTPAIDTKQADTELLINDGETIVIGGILESTDEWSESRVPFLSKIPLLGWFFTQKYKLKSKDELLIFMTPKIVRLEPKL